MNSNRTPPDGTTLRLVLRAERAPLPTTAKVLPFPRHAPRRDWQQGRPGSVDTDLAETLVDALWQDQVNGNDAVLAVVRLAEFPAFAEGIEQPEQEPCLQALGCRLGQGFGFSRPVAADAFGDLLARDPSTS